MPSDPSASTAGPPDGELTVRRGVRVVAPLTAAAVVLTAVVVAVLSQTPVLDIAKQIAYVGLGVVAPGTIVHRSLRGPQPSWLADLALGAAVGLVLELMAWAAFTALHVQRYLWAWPLLTLVLMVLLVYRGYLLDYALPPAGVPIYPDLVWHMGLVHEATRSVPLLTPQSIADGTLRYHWFSDAHIAASSLMTGTDVAVLVLPWAGALAAWLVVPTLGSTLWPGIVTASDHLNPLSPSQVFSTPLTLLLVITLVDLVRAPGRPQAATAATALIAALAAGGSKSSALPVVLGGVGAAFVAALVLRRNRLVLLGTGLVGAVLAALALAFVSGGGSGAGYQLLSALSLFAPYRELVTGAPDLRTPVLDGLVGTEGIGPILLVSLLLVTALTFGRLLAGVLPFVQRALRSDLAAWLLAGTCLTPFIPFFVIAHSGYSQFYFVLGAIPFGSALWAWSIAELVGDSRRRARAAALTVVAAVVVPARSLPTGRPAQAAELWTFSLQAAGLLAGVLAIAAAALVLRRRGHDWLLPVAACAVIAPLLVTAPIQLLRDHPRAAASPEPGLTEQNAAAAWIADNVPLYDVMATNDQCLNGRGPSCDAREWWVSGLAGRRVLLEGWAYLPASATPAGYQDPPLLALNQAAFTRPGAGTLGALRQRGVRWLVADTRAGEVSTSLATLTTRVFESGAVSVYRLD